MKCRCRVRDWEKEGRPPFLLFLHFAPAPSVRPPPARSIGQVAAAGRPPRPDRRSTPEQPTPLVGCGGRREGGREGGRERARAGGRGRKGGREIGAVVWRGAITSYLLRNHYGLPNGRRLPSPSHALYLPGRRSHECVAGLRAQVTHGSRRCARSGSERS